MEEEASPTPDDTLPDDAYFDTIAEMDALDGTLPDFPVPRPKGSVKNVKKSDASG